jgi:hypothetical protein
MENPGILEAPTQEEMAYLKEEAGKAGTLFPD